MKVYDPQGNEHEKDPVDARECVKHCGYSYEPPETEDAEDKPTKGKKNAKATDSNAPAADDSATTAMGEGDATNGPASGAAGS